MEPFDDPVFGELGYHESGCWRGEVLFEPVDDEVGIEIQTGGPTPTESHRQLFAELQHRYPALSPDVATELLRLYSEQGPGGRAEGPAPPPSAEDMIALVQLGWIELVSPTDVRLGYGFRDDLDRDDAMFTVLLTNWMARGESFSE
jgi:hypothetical protein